MLWNVALGLLAFIGAGNLFELLEGKKARNWNRFQWLSVVALVAWLWNIMGCTEAIRNAQVD